MLLLANAARSGAKVMTVQPSEDPQRVALIIGAGKQTGMGSATARALSARGNAVVVADALNRGVPNRDEVPLEGGDASWLGLESLVDTITQSGGEASMVLGDVSSEADAQRMVKYALDRHGRLDIVVNFAGAPIGPDSVDIEELSLESWDKVMSINARGSFLISRAAVAPMRQQRWGRIINLSSEVATKGGAKRSAYAASKAAILGFTRALAFDVAGWGITVNAICPGWIGTSRVTSFVRAHGVAAENVQAELAKEAERILLGRIGRPEDIAGVVTFLTSDAAAWVTGQAIMVDGGGMRAAV